MTHNHNPSDSSTSRAQKVAAMRSEQERRERRTKIGTYIGVGAAVAAIGVATAIGISGQKKAFEQAIPANTTTTFGFTVGDTAAPVVVDVYEDFQCPACGQFEEQYGPALDALIEEGTAQVNYHMMSFLGPESERATAAAGCAADLDKFREFHAAAYAVQPTEHAGGYTTGDLLQLGKDLDLGEEYAACVTDDTYASLGDKVTDEAGRRGVTGTPTVYVDGTKLTDASQVISQVLLASPTDTSAPDDNTPDEDTPGGPTGGGDNQTDAEGGSTGAEEGTTAP